MIVGLAVSTVPAALLMRRVGRRLGFVMAALVAMGGALAGAYAIRIDSFLLFCSAMVFIGANLAFVQQYRFAAAESVETPSYVGRAVSFVLLGGVVAGYLGPEIAKRGREWLEYGTYAGSFVFMASLYALVALLLLFLQGVVPEEDTTDGQERPLRRVALQPTYVVAVVAGVVGYSVMTFIMTATPISMHVIDGFSLNDSARVIQSHVIAMYLPSLFSGYVIERLGVLRVMSVGLACLSGCVFLALLGHQFVYYWTALVLLGIGWNLLFVGGTVLLTRTYRASERFKVQATNDFAIFGSQAITSLSAGAVIFRTNWEILNLLNLPVLLVMLVALLGLRRHRRRKRRAGSAQVAPAATPPRMRSS